MGCCTVIGDCLGPIFFHLYPTLVGLRIWLTIKCLLVTLLFIFDPLNGTWARKERDFSQCIPNWTYRSKVVQTSLSLRKWASLYSWSRCKGVLLPNSLKHLASKPECVENLV